MIIGILLGLRRDAGAERDQGLGSLDPADRRGA